MQMRAFDMSLQSVPAMQEHRPLMHFTEVVVSRVGGATVPPDAPKFMALKSFSVPMRNEVPVIPIFLV